MTPQEQNKLIESRLEKEAPEKILYDLIELNKEEIKEFEKIKKMTKPMFDEHERDMELYEENKEKVLSEIIYESNAILKDCGIQFSVEWLEENFEIIPKEPILKKYRK